MPHLQLDEQTFLADPPKSLAMRDGFRFVHGHTLAPFSITYETFGDLNADRSNAILVCHALSAGAHAAGKYTEHEERAGWWDGVIGYGKAIDLKKWFVVCVNFPGSCLGTTAPCSIDPATGRPWGSRYPWVTIDDMIESQRIVLDHLGIDRLHAVVGGSLGGMQALMWSVRHPERVGRLAALASAAAVPVEGVAWHIIGRKIIEADSLFNHGDYYEHTDPLRGLQIARMVGHMTYLSLESMEKKFGRRRRQGTRQFEIDSYLEYQGKKFSRTYDANSYLRVQAAMDEMDLDEEFGSLSRAFASYRNETLLISFTTDWLFPSEEVAKVHRALLENGTRSTHLVIDTINGHDAFLIDFHLISEPIRDLLER